ncbi:MAG: hypothetical protein C4297_01470 [Gemmataceae bacterium]
MQTGCEKVKEKIAKPAREMSGWIVHLLHIGQSISFCMKECLPAARLGLLTGASYRYAGMGVLGLPGKERVAD